MLLFSADLINIENSFCLFYSLSFFFKFYYYSYQATSIWYQSVTTIRDQVISVCFKFLIRYQSLSSYFVSFKSTIHLNFCFPPAVGRFKSANVCLLFILFHQCLRILNLFRLRLPFEQKRRLSRLRGHHRL